MSNRETTAYYVAAGKSLAAIEEWVAADRRVTAKWEEFRKKHGAKDIVYSRDPWTGSREMCGLVFPGELPAGWEKRAGKEYATPSKRSKVGKEIAREMRSLQTPSMGGDVGEPLFLGGRVYTLGVRQLGDKWVISHHEKAKAPADAIPLKRSEYWALVEAHETGDEKPITDAA